LVEAAQGKIGNAVDQLMLYCYRYDAAMGRYTPMILNLVRAGGVLTLVGLAALIFWMRRKPADSRAGVPPLGLMQPERNGR